MAVGLVLGVRRYQIYVHGRVRGRVGVFRVCCFPFQSRVREKVGRDGREDVRIGCRQRTMKELCSEEGTE